MEQLPIKNNLQLPTENALQSYGIAIAEIGIRGAVIRKLAAQANLQNVKIHDETNTPFVIGAPTELPDEAQFVSKQLGTVVYSAIIFNSGISLNNDGSVKDSWGDMRIDDCLIRVSQSKKIVVTEIQGRDGTVKEYIGLDDFQVQINGRLNGAYGVNPKDMTKHLKTILSAGQPIAITSWYLQNLDIVNIVVKDFDFPQAEGEYSTQYFSINAISDNVVEARITGQ